MSPSATPTETAVASGGARDPTRFVPGAVLARRYRVVGLLGRGGMGEVYRADDLKLGQAVALKFLPPGFERDENRLRRFTNEVRIARQVTHSNVCRIHDIGEIDGQHFLSMEYVDGEDLASLLLRIGRLSRDKAVQIARQLCAGLAAAHEQGILHRDIKPENVMIDGRGRVRITDFGVAAAAEGIEGSEIRAGTPRYMSPEQLAGKEVTVRSDLYSLGLVLYELFTGRRAFGASSLPELIRLQEETVPAAPSSLVEGLDESVDAVISSCLEREPTRRPASVIAVSAALPGGDTLKAAMDAGETPSPEMVADAGGVGGLRPAIGLACLALIVVGLSALPVARSRCFVDGEVALDNPPVKLCSTAREIIEAAGYDPPPVDSAFGFEYAPDLREYIGPESRHRDPTSARNSLSPAHPPLIHFWYRQSPDPLIPAWGFGKALTSAFQAGFHYVTPENPPNLVPGTVDVRLDPQGRLLRFRAVPPRVEGTERPSEESSWSAMFAKAGLDLASFEPAQPPGDPPINWDSRYAWAGSYADRADIPIRVEAFAHRNHLVFFEIVWPEAAHLRREESETTTESEVGTFAHLVTLAALLIAGFALARRNLRFGRANRKGAFRLAMFVFILGISYGGLQTKYALTSEGIAALVDLAAGCLLRSAIVWLFYVALEPYARRLWPESLISWGRLLEGRFRDPMIGRDILVGALAGLSINFWMYLYSELTRWFDLPVGGLFVGMLESLAGSRMAASQVPLVLLSGFFSLANLFLLLVLLIVFRLRWLAMAVFVLGRPVFALGVLEFHPLMWVFLVVSGSMILLVLVRFGLLASAIMFSLGDLHFSFVLASGLSAWYLGRTVVVLVVFAAVAVYGFRISLAGRPVFRDRILDG